MMKRLIVVVSIVFLVGFSAGVDSGWQFGRIVDVRKSVTARTRAWVVNTPITDEVTSYTIWVHLQNHVLTGTYEVTPEYAAPPAEWKTKYPVQVQLQGDTMYMRGPTGEVRLHITQRKAARPLLPLTADEKKQLAEIENPSGSLIGFSQESKVAAGQTKLTPSAEAPPPAPTAPPNAGTITVRSTPYLSEVFVDGESMGYTPAKISLPPGKHAFRVEKPGYKPWTKESTLTLGSELTLDASLEKK
jgi:hypothetical protein